METRWGLFRTNTYQTSNTESGKHVEFNGSSGNLAVSSGSGQAAGLITLPTARAYLVKGSIKYATTSTDVNDYVGYQWYDGYGDPIGIAGRYRPNDLASFKEAEAVVDIRTSPSETLTLRVTGWSSTPKSFMGFADISDVTESTSLPTPDGGAGAGGGTGGTGLMVGTFYHVLTADDITLGAFNLDVPAYAPSEILLDVITGGPQHFGVDFMADTNQIIFAGYTLGSMLEAGEVVRLHYMFDPAAAIPLAPMGLIGVSEETLNYKNVTMVSFVYQIKDSDIQNKRIVLPSPAAHPEDITFNIKDMVHAIYGVHYIANPYQIEWNGLALDGIIQEGMTVEIRYIVTV